MTNSRPITLLVKRAPVEEPLEADDGSGEFAALPGVVPDISDRE